MSSSCQLSEMSSPVRHNCITIKAGQLDSDSGSLCFAEPCLYQVLVRREHRVVVVPKNALDPRVEWIQRCNSSVVGTYATLRDYCVHIYSIIDRRNGIMYVGEGW